MLNFAGLFRESIETMMNLVSMCLVNDIMIRSNASDMYVKACVCVCICVCASVCVCVCLCVYLRACVRARVCVSVGGCLFVWMLVCAFAMPGIKGGVKLCHEGRETAALRRRIP